MVALQDGLLVYDEAAISNVMKTVLSLCVSMKDFGYVNPVTVMTAHGHTST